MLLRPFRACRLGDFTQGCASLHPGLRSCAASRLNGSLGDNLGAGGGGTLGRSNRSLTVAAQGLGAGARSVDSIGARSPSHRKLPPQPVVAGSDPGAKMWTKNRRLSFCGTDTSAAFLTGCRGKYMRDPLLLRCACSERLGVAALRRWTGRIAGPYDARLVLTRLSRTSSRHVVRNAGSVGQGP